MIWIFAPVALDLVHKLEENANNNKKIEDWAAQYVMEIDSISIWNAYTCS